MNDGQFEIGDYIQIDSRIDPEQKFGKLVQKLSGSEEYVVEILGKGVRKPAKLDSGNSLLTTEAYLIKLKFQKLNKSGSLIKKENSNVEHYFSYDQNGASLDISKYSYRGRLASGNSQFNSDYCFTNFYRTKSSSIVSVLVKKKEEGNVLDEPAFYQEYGSARNLNAVLKKINFDSWNVSLHEVLS